MLKKKTKHGWKAANEHKKGYTLIIKSRGVDRLAIFSITMLYIHSLLTAHYMCEKTLSRCNVTAFTLRAFFYFILFYDKKIDRQ